MTAHRLGRETTARPVGPRTRLPGYEPDGRRFEPTRGTCFFNELARSEQPASERDSSNNERRAVVLGYFVDEAEMGISGPRAAGYRRWLLASSSASDAWRSRRADRARVDDPQAAVPEFGEDLLMHAGAIGGLRPTSHAARRGVGVGGQKRGVVLS